LYAANLTVFPDRVGRLQLVILSCGAFEKVKLYKLGTLSRLSSRDIQKAASDPLATRKRFIAINIVISRLTRPLK